MDIEVARHVVKTAFRSSSELTNLYAFINEHCVDEALKESLKSSLAQVIADIGYNFNKKITDIHPEVQEEIDHSIETYGFLIRQ
ncbi:hypothetical protein [Microbulbifer sp. ZKSA002]|uniref:hypothetical protein n=1 Tax=Microbulbifer sp. ZKSA002 TaxID=3243388 RepID=UPI00403A1CFA